MGAGARDAVGRTPNDSNDRVPEVRTPATMSQVPTFAVEYWLIVPASH